MKVYIASENHGVDTSAGFVRKCFMRSIELGRKFAQSGDDKDLFEALRLLGTGLHTLEDYAAHSNYLELALRELNVDAFPHVGANCQVNVNGKQIWPVVTGTFGMTDFLHSVVGEVSDKMIQSEVQTLENMITDAHSGNHSDTTSKLKEILDVIPFGLLGLGDSGFGDEAQKLQEQSDAKEMETKAKISSGNTTIDQLQEQASVIGKEIYPILEYHDKVMKAITKGVDMIPGAAELMENLAGAMQIYIFSVLAPYIMPILQQVKAELGTGSEGILKASEKGQYAVFNEDDSSDPTHSMLSKDHFTNVLNEPAGRVASEIVRFVVPQITAAWENESIDANRVCNEVLQVLHHPALRSMEGQRKMFEVVRQWWEEKSNSEKSQLADALSKAGVKEGRNHEGEDPLGGPGSKNHSHSGFSQGSGGTQQRRDGYGSSQQSGYSSSRPQMQYQQEERPSRREPVQSYQHQEQSSGGLDITTPAGLGGLLGNLMGAALSGGVQGSTSEVRGGRSEDRSSYGGNQASSYGNQSEERSSYGRAQDSSYGNQSEARRSYGRAQDSSYGNQSETKSSYGRSGDNSYGVQSGGGSSYVRGEGDSYGVGHRTTSEVYGGQPEERSSYGRGERNPSGVGHRSTSELYGSQSEESSSYGRNQGSSYGGQSEERSSYGGNVGNTYSGQSETRSSYGRGEGDSYGGGHRSTSEVYGSQSGESGSYGRNQGGSYGGQSEESSSYERNQGSSYGGRPEERSSHGRGERNPSGVGHRSTSEVYGSQSEESGSYGRNQGGSYGGQSEESSSYGRNQGSSYGGRSEHRRKSEDSSDGSRSEERSSHGGRSHRY